MAARNRCGLCKKEASVITAPGPASVKLIQLYNKDYKGARLCTICLEMAKRRVAAQAKNNRENEDPNTSSSGSSVSVNRPETEPTTADSRTERGDSLQAQKGTQTTKSFSQPIGSRESSRDNVPSFLPANAQQELSQEPSSSESPQVPAALEAFTPRDEEEESRKRSPERNASPMPSPKRPRTNLIVEESEETIEEREEDAPPEEVVQQLVEEEDAPEVPTVDADEDVQEAEISNVSSAAPMPRNPRIRDEGLRINMERSQALDSRGEGLVNNMPRTHAG